MMSEFNALDQAAVDSLRLLAVDMVEAAHSGHPGLPLGAAPMAYVLLTRYLKHNPEDPGWPGRDRFILSAGHGSALLYAWLHLAGYGLTLDDLKNFRQYKSRTPGHPERGLTPGVEATTGPLGQGFAMGVGLAMAERHLAARYNRPDYELFNYHTYALVSDGDLMEGLSGEAASLAGSLGLGRLICLYDDNEITIEGRTSLSFNEDVSARFQAYGWQVIRVADGNNMASIKVALENARADKDRPSLIMVKTQIGYGSPKADTPSAHGEPLGPEAAAATRVKFGRAEDEVFIVSGQVREHYEKMVAAQLGAYEEWQALKKSYAEAYPELAGELALLWAGGLPSGWDENRPVFPPDKPVATRVAGGLALNALAARIPWLIGGSADLAPSTKTALTAETSFGPGNYQGRNIHFGIREAAMGAIMNGLALSGLRPFGSTFLVFSDYLRPALRLSALMKTKTVYVFSHDSLGVGEDGPTHQPVEHLAALRAIPGLRVFRPADANEAVAAWQTALSGNGPAALALSRQNLPVLDPEKYPALKMGGPKRGAYVLNDPAAGRPQAVIIATGSEVSVALAAQELLAARDIKTRVVSMPSWEVFAEQDQAYRDLVLPPDIEARVAIEAGVKMGWERYLGPRGLMVSQETFGLSAPAGEVFQAFGFTPEHLARVVERALAG